MMQKELGRYLFSVFLEKRKIDRHLKKYPPKESLGRQRPRRPGPFIFYFILFGYAP